MADEKNLKLNSLNEEFLDCKSVNTQSSISIKSIQHKIFGLVFFLALLFGFDARYL